MATYRAFQVTGQRQFELVDRELVAPDPGHYTEALPDEKAVTAIGFMQRAPRLVHRTRHHPHPADRHRQRCLLPGQGIRPRAARRSTSVHRSLHPHKGNVERYHPILARSSSTLALGPQKPNGPKRSRSGTSTSTTIDHTLPAQASPSLATRHRRHQSHGLIKLAIPRIVTELDRACASSNPCSPGHIRYRTRVVYRVAHNAGASWTGHSRTSPTA
jgi:hypothetical protein